MDSKTRLVYSTGTGRVREEKPAVPAPKGDGQVRVTLVKQGKGGKAVTQISGVPLEGEELQAYARILKQKCGCGGTVQAGLVEIQGDKRDLILADALARGWKAKKAGG